MIRVAVIGYPGSGCTTLADALAAVSCTHPVRALEHLWTPLQSSETLVLDGLPRSVHELELIDAKAPAHAGIGRVLYLEAPVETRLARTARMAASGSDPGRDRDHALDPAALNDLRQHLAPAGRLTVIDADRSRSEVLADALDALGIGA